MESSQLEAERSIATDISMSFWPFLPNNVLVVGQQSASLATCIAEILPMTRVTLVTIDSLPISSLHFNQFIDRINVVSGWQGVYNSGYPIILAVSHFLPLESEDQVHFLSTALRYLEADGRVLLLEKTIDDSNSQLTHMVNLCHSAGFFDVTISPMENTPWISILFRREKDSLRCREPTAHCLA